MNNILVTLADIIAYNMGSIFKQIEIANMIDMAMGADNIVNLVRA
jgi:hypothetical protein